MLLTKIQRISVLIINGIGITSNKATDAIQFLKKYSEGKPKQALIKYEIIIRYNTGDKIEASFKDKKDAINFLETYN